jgi:SAM-dependent methyltransferase
MDLKESAILGDFAEEHWYYQSKAAAMCLYVKGIRKSLVLDVGAGSGFFTKFLLRHTPAQTGLCVDTGYASDSDEEYAGKLLQFRRSCTDVAADLVLLMDVLEHVKDDAELLAEYAEKVPSGARFLITVPAFQWLWSDHDVFLEHHRRYDIQQLEAIVSRVGLGVQRSSYYFGFVLPIAGVLRLRVSPRRVASRAPQSQLKKHGWLTNAALASICRAELPIFRINRLGGLSVFCLATKP